MFRRLRYAVTGVAFAGLGSVGMLSQAAPASAASSPSAAEQFIADINALRASVGVGALRENATLDSMAHGWSLHLESAGSLSHNPSLTAEAPSNWRKLGENVGVGPSVPALQTAFTNSPEHYTNMVDGSFNQIGVDVEIDSNGALWVTEDYMQAPLVAPAPAPSPTPAPAPAPVVHSAPAPAPVVHTAPAPAPVVHSAPTPVVQPLSVPVTPPHAAVPVAPTPSPAVAAPPTTTPAPVSPPGQPVASANAAAPEHGKVLRQATFMKLTPVASDPNPPVSALKGAALAAKTAAVWGLDLAIPASLVVLVLIMRRPQRGRRRPVWA